MILLNGVPRTFGRDCKCLTREAQSRTCGSFWQLLEQNIKRSLRIKRKVKKLKKHFSKLEAQRGLSHESSYEFNKGAAPSWAPRTTTLLSTGSNLWTWSLSFFPINRRIGIFCNLEWIGNSELFAAQLNKFFTVYVSIFRCCVTFFELSLFERSHGIRF